MRKILRIVAYFVTALIGILIIGLILALITYPPEYVFRVLAWQDSDVDDYTRFPEHLIEASGNPFQFAESLDEDRVATAFERNDDIDNLNDFLEQTGTQAFIVIENDTIVYEGYFNDTKRESIVTSFSVAKSFGSALIGIAIEDGYIGAVDDSITEYIPELIERDPQFANITIRNLLMMSSGINYVEFPFLHGDNAKTYYFPDLRQLALEDTNITGPSGEVFLYNNYHPLLLGLILERTTGQTVGTYLQDRIWQSIGTEYDASWSLDSEATAFEKMESGINARAIDFAKFGRLYLNGGNWDGTQVISAAWVEDSITTDTRTSNAAYYEDDFGLGIYDDGTGYYKYMWYGIGREAGGFDFYAAGNHGQYIYLSPSTNLIIVRFGKGYGIDHFKWIEMFYQFASDY